MIAFRPASLGTLLLPIVLGCTSPASTPVRDKPEPESKLPAACNVAVSDAQAAIELAREAKLLAGFPDGHDVIDDPPVRYRLFDIGPMVPAEWPSRDCALVLYVYEAYTEVTADVYEYRRPVTARITLRLDDGSTQVEKLDSLHFPSDGGLLYSGADPLSAADQQAVFAAVAHSADAIDLSALGKYQEWLREEPFFAGTLDILHRGFLAEVLTNRPDILELARAHSASWYELHAEGGQTP